MTTICCDRKFMCGVIEGFYGKPWSTEQRKQLFERMNCFGMAVYMYAPKDDYKHRLYWRDQYGPEESEELKNIINAAKMENVTFVYAISPGLDIRYSSKEEMSILKQKIDQVRQFGCDCFALLFDDIEPDLSACDSEVFPSVAHAQAAVTNELYTYTGCPKVFLFCPTEYCSSRAEPDLTRSSYLRTLGETLHPAIDVFWTGPKVVSRLITVESILAVSKILRRPPTIWDNLHADDYDQTRMYLGPYDGRPQQLTNYLHGVLTNPNCEFELNFIAMHTLSQWSKNTVQRFAPVKSTVKIDTANILKGYQPNQALLRAVEDWIPEFYIPRGALPSAKTLQRLEKIQESLQDHVQSESTVSETCDHYASSTLTDDCTHDKAKMKHLDKEQSSAGDSHADEMDTKNEPDAASSSRTTSTGSTTHKRLVEDIDPLQVSDILLLCDLFYLPFAYGPRAIHLLKSAHWLINNLSRLENVTFSHQVAISERPPEVREWYERAVQFHESYRNIVLLVDKIVNIPNRRLLYEMYNYISDMRSTLSLLNNYVKWNGLGQPDKEPYRNGEQEPWVHRSGIYSEFRRLLPMEGDNDMFPAVGKQPQPLQVFTIRPYQITDKDAMYNICRKTCEDGQGDSDIFEKYPELVADDCIGGLMEVCPQFCYVLEDDDDDICGYAISACDVKEYQKLLAEVWLPKMRHKYPKTDEERKENSAISTMLIETFHGDPAPIPDDLYTAFPSFIQLSVLDSCICGQTVILRLLNCSLSCLRHHGSRGVHTVIHSSHSNLLAFYLRLGFEDISNIRQTGDDLTVLGRKI